MVLSRSSIRRSVTYAGVAAGMVSLAFVPTQAAQPSSTVLVDSTALPALDIDSTVGPVSGSVNAGLDSGCLAALSNPQGKGQSYAIDATSSNSAVTPSPAERDNLQCSTTLPAPFTIATATWPGDTATLAAKVAACSAVGQSTITLTPIAAHGAGLTSKLKPAYVPVTVNDSKGHCAGISTGPGGGGTNPAAPAVANTYLNNNSDVAGPCANAWGPKAWRGALISAIAHWMPTPESVKDSTTLFPDDTWAAYVQNEVDTACGLPLSGPSVTAPTGMPAYSTLK